MTGTDSGRLWGGQFAGGPAEAMFALEPVRPVRLATRPARPRRVPGAALALHAADLLTTTSGRIAAGLASLDDTDVAAGAFVPRTPTRCPRRAGAGLIERVGPELGGGYGRRSRNDQIATLIQAYLRDANAGLAANLRGLIQALAGRRRTTSGRSSRPAPTSSRPSPSCSATSLLRHAWPLVRTCGVHDLDARLAVGPYGSGPSRAPRWASTPSCVARELGFAGSVPNGITAPSRDLVAEHAYVLAQDRIDLSRLSET